MFVCDACHVPSAPGEQPVRVVVERRKKTYPFRAKANRATRSRRAEEDSKFDPTADPGGTGWEIVREKTVCAGCAAVAMDDDAEMALVGLPARLAAWARRQKAVGGATPLIA